MGNKIVTIKLPFKVSTNKIYAGCHWRTRAKHKDDMVAAFEGFKAVPFDVPVDVHMEFYLKGRALDSSNCSYMFKIIEDCLVKAGYMTNDTIQYVRKISMESNKAESNYVEVTFTERV